ncbi:DNA methyltransferase [Vagococcus fluvialis]|uniref:DNA methyltransferase n=1 Tax=Vagococcus fluvialis TaxID=2738 RepID=UPI003B58E355
METKLNREIRTVLEKFDSKYIIDGIINKSQVIRDLDQYDAELVTEILTNEELKKRFTLNVAGATVIKVNDFIEVFEQDEYWQDSYTKYSKKIGLTINGKFLDETSEVVLDFPYKDTVLKASMSKEDNDKSDLKPDEPFLNEVIAQDEIDTLLDKKVLVNAKKYDAEGEREVTEITEDDNLILKGNNLLGLHTIKEGYLDKIKSIYLDVPYNTGSDSFEYNDRFNHSAWLTFIKNRLDIARDFLKSEGVIFVQCDDNEQAYLKVLLDDIFGKENFIANFIWEKRTNRENRKMVSGRHEYILCYSRQVDLKNKVIKQLKMSEKALSNYKNPDNDSRGPWKSDPATAQAGHATPSQFYNLIAPNGKIHELPSGRCWLYTEEVMKKAIKDNRIWFGKEGNGVPRKKTYLNEKERGLTVETIWFAEDVSTSEIAKNSLKSLFDGEAIFLTPKPEHLLQRVLEIATDENDIVLDFFMGSATTQAVAMKMNRRFIGIEQMDYINTVSVPRLQKVIEGEQGGISKDVNWQGGGSFVYAELMEKNTGFIKEIINAQNMIELQVIFKRMIETADFDFRVNLAEIQKDDLWQQSLDDQKRILIKVIDKNQLYYNYSEIDDENVRDLISDNDYAFNKSFYADRGE